MIQLLIIADDFTGALDTGVQFSAAGISTIVTKNIHFDLTAPNPSNTVLVVDCETRHLSGAEARLIVRELAHRAATAGIRRIYKKTDSTLRGNIGTELQAVLEGTGAPRIHFIPAFPEMGRITIEGIHYVNGQPVADSVFGKDPFEPVVESNVQALLTQQTSCEVHYLGNSVPTSGLPEGICIYGAASTADMRRIAQALRQHDTLNICAGCAGFASLLPDMLGLQGKPCTLPAWGQQFLVACGSLNPITQAQLRFAEEAGIPCIHLTPEMKYDDQWIHHPAAAQILQDFADTIRSHSMCILDTSSLPAGKSLCPTGSSVEKTRGQVSRSLGLILKWLISQNVCSTLFITGGDCLVAFLDTIKISELHPLCELLPGVVLSQFLYQGHVFNLLSKSGGFGEESLLLDIIQVVQQQPVLV